MSYRYLRGEGLPNIVNIQWDSTGTPQGLHGDSTGTPRGLHGDSTGLHGDSTGTLLGLHRDSTGTSQGLLYVPIIFCRVGNAMI